MAREQTLINRALKPGMILADRYEIGCVLGEGGFGITYEGRQLEKNKKVAIKEYFPSALATREDVDSNQNLHIFRGKNEGDYEKGKQRFLREAEILREFQYLEGIVSVLDFLECNRTAYIVMEYVEGITLKQYVKENGSLSYPELMKLLAPVMRSLIQIHRQGLIHRDISPDNLLIGLDNRARLIDFGAANRINERTRKLKTVILKAGYAPPEQYLEEGRQGPWTDVYGLSAMMYMALTGRVPTDSVARLQGTELPKLDLQSKGMEEWQAEALYHGMELNIARRYKNVEELYNALTIPTAKEDRVTENKDALPLEGQAVLKAFMGRRSRKVIAVFFICLAVILAGGSLFLREGDSGNLKKIAGQAAIWAQTADMKMAMTEDKQPEEEMQICTMPNVVGMSEENAKNRIGQEDGSIRIVITRVYSDIVKQGQVVGQSVEAGTVYNIGAITEIVLTVSDGEEALPDTEEQESVPFTGTSQDSESDTTKKDDTKKKTTESEYQFTEESDYEEFDLGD